jgi:predicted short-subunit dehydrogenase-like oxidoreductase (DUF2520 family)
VTSFSTRPRLAVGIVGAGRVGSVLGAALRNAGHSVVAAAGVSEASRRRAERLLPGVPLQPPDEVVRRSTMVLLAVPDDTLPELVEGLAVTGAFRAGQIVAHTSGRFGLAVLAPATAHAVLPLALHPVMTFTGSALDLPRLAGATFGVTAPETLRPAAEALVLEMGAEPAAVAEEARQLYHAALAHGANHLVTLVNSAADILRVAGIDDPAGMLGPLLSAALDNALNAGDAALTGPVARGDAATVRTHLHALGCQAPDSLPLYRALARATADRALAARIVSLPQAAELLDILAETHRAETDRAEPSDPDGARA